MARSVQRLIEASSFQGLNPSANLDILAAAWYLDFHAKDVTARCASSSVAGSSGRFYVLARVIVYFAMNKQTLRRLGIIL